MKTILIAATLAVMTAAPVAACADKGGPQPNKVTETMLFQSDSDAVAPSAQAPLLMPARPHAPRFIGPYELHDGLLPNGLTPNPPTYG